MKRVAIVTGANRGIGKAIARRLAADGIAVALLGRRTDELNGLREELSSAGAAAWSKSCDLRTLESAAASDLAHEIQMALGPVEVLINNAGIAVSEPVSRMSDPLWDEHMAVNLTAPFRLIRAVLPQMLELGTGRIVNIASVAAEFPLAYACAYAASKAGLVGLTKALAAEVGAQGVTVNAVCPGWVDTEMARLGFARAAAKTGKSVEEIAAKLVQGSSQRRMLAPSEVADLVAYLVSPEASAVNGQAWIIGGP